MNEEILSLMEQLKMFDYQNDVIEAVTHGDIGDPDETMEASSNAAEEDPTLLSRLVDCLKKLAEDGNQNEFWDWATENGHPPTLFQVLCASVITKTGFLRKHGAILYAQLLCMVPLSSLWNQILFNTLLSIMMNATQVIDSRNTPNDDEADNLFLAANILDTISEAICPQFLEYATIDGLTALIELAFKLSSGYSDDLSAFNAKLQPAALRFLEKTSLVYLDYILPYLVTTLLLDFLPPSAKTMNQKIVAKRDFYLEFAKDKLKEKQTDLLLVIKHLLVRCSERSMIRANVCYCVNALAHLLVEKEPLFLFVKAMLRSGKSVNRTLALDIVKTFIDDDGFVPADTILQFTTTLYNGISDNVSTVRAVTLDTLSSIISKIEYLPNQEDVRRSIGLPDSLLEKIEHRVTDEKLIVRKSAIRCLKAMLPLMKRDPYENLSMIADRTRDVAVSLRQEAAKLLTSAIEDMNNLRAYAIWFDAILPLSMDVDEKTKTLALTIINDTYLSRISTAEGETMTESIDPTHLNLLSHVIPLLKQKGINFKALCQTVQCQIATESSSNIWAIAGFLISEVPEFFNGAKILKMWDDRKKLPVDYYKLVSYCNRVDSGILQDTIDLMNGLSEDISEAPDDIFNWIHYCVKIIKNMSEDNEVFLQLFKPLNEKMNIIAEDPQTSTSKLDSIAPALFLLGETLPFIDSINDYDFTGTQLLMTEELPNGVVIPQRVRAIASITLGKLCLRRRDVSHAFVAAFARQLKSTDDPAVKCNCLIVLCDLCVAYTSTVDPYVQEMTSCFVDKYPVVRKQALLILTRLITEEFVKMRPLMFFRFVSALTDKNTDVASFARSCLFDVLLKKSPKLIIHNFIDTLRYFNGLIDSATIYENEDYKDAFKMKSTKIKRNAFCQLVSHMPDDQLFDTILNLCSKVLQKFIDEELDLEKSGELLSDSIYMMLKIEDQMEAINVNEASVDDPRHQLIVEESRKVVGLIHDQLIERVLPTLNEMNRFLRSRNSPLQSELRVFFRKLCEKNASLIDELKTKEPILAAEIEHDLSIIKTPMPEEEESGQEEQAPQFQQVPFRSPLLSRIISTPKMTLVQTSANASPMSVLPQKSMIDPTRKRTIIPFNLDEDE